MKLSKEQASLLDRQIRLFGFDLQKRLLQARVLVAPLNPAAVEFAKNVLLAGLAVDFFDDALVSEKDAEENFLMNASHIGKTRREVIEPFFREMNPQISLSFNSLSDLEKNDLSGYDLIVLDTETIEQACLWNEKTRANKKPMIAFFSYGFSGAFFVDFGEIFEVEIEISEPGAQNKKPGQEKEKKFSHKAFEFFPLRDYLEKMARKPEEAAEHNGSRLLLEAYRKEKDHSMIIENRANRKYPPTISVLAAVCSQEIVNFFERKRQPVHQLFVYDSFEGSGQVFSLSASN